MHLLIVCLGNICRSPMAEGALRQRLAAAGLNGQVSVDSVGTGDWHVGQPPDPRAVAMARRHGVDISGLRGRHLAAADYVDFDWLLCADATNLRDVRARAPVGATARSELLLAWAGLGAGSAIPDPYTGDAEGFLATWQLVDAAAVAICAADSNGSDRTDEFQSQRKSPQWVAESVRLISPRAQRNGERT